MEYIVRVNRFGEVVWFAELLCSEVRMCVVQNSEILTLTYGGIVRQLIADTENVGEVNRKLKKM